MRDLEFLMGRKGLGRVMAASTQISVRIDSDVKETASEVLDEIGMPMTTAINIFLKRVGRERRFPFELSADPFYDPSNIAYLEERKREADAGHGEYSEHRLIEP